MYIQSCMGLLYTCRLYIKRYDSIIANCSELPESTWIWSHCLLCVLVLPRNDTDFSKPEVQSLSSEWKEGPFCLQWSLELRRVRISLFSYKSATSPLTNLHFLHYKGGHGFNIGGHTKLCSCTKLPLKPSVIERITGFFSAVAVSS